MIWMSETPLKAGDRYLARHAGRFVKARIDAVLYAVDVNTMEQRQAGSLELNGIGRVVVETTQPLYLDAYAANRATGSLILVDPQQRTAAARSSPKTCSTTRNPAWVGDAPRTLRDHLDRREFHW